MPIVGYGNSGWSGGLAWLKLSQEQFRVCFPGNTLAAFPSYLTDV